MSVTRRASLPGADELFRNTAEEQQPPPPPAPAPVQQAPVQQAPVQQAPVQQAPVQQAPVQQAPVQQAPVQQAPVQQAPVQQAPVDDSYMFASDFGAQETSGHDDESLSARAGKSVNQPVPESTSRQVAESSKRDGAMRPKHEEKVTFYCTPEELTRLERARLVLRAEHRLPTDRGRIVRASLAEVLDEFESRGRDSSLVRRLRGANSNGKQQR